ncbi:hypothetical protein AB4K20DRAFT_1960186 [Rhizopus microsporus]
MGACTCSLLVTSSFRLDSVSVNMGSATSHFKPSNSTKIYLKHSIELVKTMLSDPAVNCSQTLPSLYMPKQVLVNLIAFPHTHNVVCHSELLPIPERSM